MGKASVLLVPVSEWVELYLLPLSLLAQACHGVNILAACS